MRQSSFAPVFVDVIPEDLESGVLYLSTRFRTASHLCACGCGDRVVTPIKPAKWRFTFDGESVSLHPSIGRWQSTCQAHYWITRNQVMWARSFNERERDAVLRKDREDLGRYYSAAAPDPTSSTTANAQGRRSGVVGRLLRRLRRSR